MSAPPQGTAFPYRHPYITVSAKGISNGLSVLLNDGADFGVDTLQGATGPGQYGPPYSNTSGIQEAVNYVAGLGGMMVLLKEGTFTITSTAQVAINIPFNVPLRILGEGKGITVLQAPYGFFQLLPGSSQNTNPIEIGRMTLKTTQASSSAGGYFVVGNSLYGWANIYIHDMDMYGGGNVSTGPFNIGSFNGVQGGAPLTNVLLRNLYLDTLGTTNGNEAYTFPNIYGDDFILDNVTYNNTSGPGVGFYGVYGGVIVWKNSVLDASNPSYINTQSYSSTASATATNLFTKLILDNVIIDSGINNGGQTGFIPLDLILNNSVVRFLNPLTGSNGTYHSLIISNVFISEEYNSFITKLTAEYIKLVNVTLPDDNNQKSSAGALLNLSLPYQSMTINIDIENLYAGKPANQILDLLNLPQNTSSITAQYNIKWKGIGWPTQWAICPSSGIGCSVYDDPNGFAQMVNANPSYFLSVDFEWFDKYNNIAYRVLKNPNTPSTPTVPASGTAQANANSYPVEVYLSGGSATEVQATKYGNTYTIWSASTATAIPPLAIRLNPGDSITITYSTAPTWTWTPA
jgi:translation initiation factor 2 beta subunit (eIF-2beta)/eIF-5